MRAGRIVFVLMFAFAVVVLSVSVYGTAYIQLGSYNDRRVECGEEARNLVTRHYMGRAWCLTLFAPAAAVESNLIGCPVFLTYREEPIVVYDGESLDLEEPAE